MPIDLSSFDPAAITASCPGLVVLNSLKPGAQKRVWRVLYNGNEYVLKVYVDDPLTTPRAEREVEILRRCNCPYLAAVGPIVLTRIEITPPDEAVLFYLEQFIDGTPVNDLNKPLSTAEVVKLAQCSVAAIGSLGQLGYLHRDIKPQNMVRRTNGDYVLLDVGLALDFNGVSITNPGGVVGTPGYISPEQLMMSKRDLDFRADLFALGIVMYECATAVHPFWNPRMPIVDVKQNIVQAQPLSPKVFAPQVPDKLSAIIGRLLQKQRHLRYGRLDQLLNDLGKV